VLAGTLKFATIPSAKPCAKAAPAGGKTFALVDRMSAAVPDLLAYTRSDPSVSLGGMGGLFWQDI
jgi:hypothetical protein